MGASGHAGQTCICSAMKALRCRRSRVTASVKGCRTPARARGKATISADLRAGVGQALTYCVLRRYGAGARRRRRALRRERQLQLQGCSRTRPCAEPRRAAVFLLTLPSQAASRRVNATPAQGRLREHVITSNGVLLVCQRDLNNRRLNAAQLVPQVVPVRGWPPKGSSELAARRALLPGRGPNQPTGLQRSAAPVARRLCLTPWVSGTLRGSHPTQE